jgi:hypothetical protein
MAIVDPTQQPQKAARSLFARPLFLILMMVKMRRTMLAHDLHYLCVMKALKTRLLQAHQIVGEVVLAVGTGEAAKTPGSHHLVQIGLLERSV